MIFRSTRFQIVARLMAILLLVWTSADLCGHGVCAHDREPIAPWSAPAPSAPTAMGTPGGPAPAPAPADGPDDCFCCCHCIDVQVRFQLPATRTFFAMVFVGRVSAPVSISSPFDHPPSA